MIRRVLGITAISLLTLAGGRRAQACSCAVPPPPLEELAASDAVFEATVIRAASSSGTSATQVAVTMEVAQVWKGDISRQTTVYTAPNDAACGVDLQLGVAYLIYGRSDGGRIVVSLCSRTQALAFAQDDVRQLGAGMPPRPGTDVPPAASDGGCRLGGGGGGPAAGLLALAALGLLRGAGRRRH
jgi:hypothetical protein